MTPYDNPSYIMMLEEVKALILPTILERINPEDLKLTGLEKDDYADIVYTQIMALGYNEGDINASVNDLLPTRNPFIYPGPDELEAVNMAMHLVIVSEDFKHQVWSFQQFHKLTQEYKPYKEVMLGVKRQLLAAQLGF
ncbi:MAG: hypothetical protein JST49_09060 [Bacteroidetes bacterium]|nr:hypothetical protein [Bacteroidota bacterium]